MGHHLDISVESERLMLRNLRSDDVSQDYVDWLNDADINRFLSCHNRLQTIETCQEYVSLHADKTDKVLIGIFLKSGLLHIGNVTFSNVDWEKMSAAIGICVGRKGYQGKGFAKEAIKAMVGYSFERLGLRQINAGVHKDNHPSIQLFKTCGFSIKDIIRWDPDEKTGDFDGYLFGITCAEYSQKSECCHEHRF